jgi:hypothetical protein
LKPKIKFGIGCHKDWRMPQTVECLPIKGHFVTQGPSQASVAAPYIVEKLSN